MATKCDYCQKTVFHAEEQKFDGKIFHQQCMGKYNKEARDKELEGRNVMYRAQADVQPAYYRTADHTGQAKMESGSDYKTS